MSEIRVKLENLPDDITVFQFYETLKNHADFSKVCKNPEEILQKLKSISLDLPLKNIDDKWYYNYINHLEKTETCENRKRTEKYFIKKFLNLAKTLGFSIFIDYEMIEAAITVDIMN